jgi:hypothetical protein
MYPSLSGLDLRAGARNGGHSEAHYAQPRLVIARAVSANNDVECDDQKTRRETPKAHCSCAFDADVSRSADAGQT